MPSKIYKDFSLFQKTMKHFSTAENLTYRNHLEKSITDIKNSQLSTWDSFKKFVYNWTPIGYVMGWFGYKPPLPKASDRVDAFIESEMKTVRTDILDKNADFRKKANHALKEVLNSLKDTLGNQSIRGSYRDNGDLLASKKEVRIKLKQPYGNKMFNLTHQRISSANISKMMNSYLKKDRKSFIQSIAKLNELKKLSNQKEVHLKIIE